MNEDVYRSATETEYLMDVIQAIVVAGVSEKTIFPSDHGELSDDERTLSKALPVITEAVLKAYKEVKKATLSENGCNAKTEGKK